MRHRTPILCFQVRDIHTVTLQRTPNNKMEGGATYWSELLESKSFAGSGLMDVVDRLSTSDVILFAQTHRPTEAQANGALRELQNFLFTKTKTVTVSEAANAAAAILGFPSEFNKLPVGKIPELALVPSAQRTENQLVAQMLGVVQTETSLPPVPLETSELQAAVEAVAAVMQQAGMQSQSAASMLTNAASESAIASAGPAALQEQLVNAARAPNRQTLLWLLVVSIPLLLQSFIPEVRIVGVALLTFFFALMTNNTALVFEVRGVLLSMQAKR